MKINEVEKLLGITKANIRFYEKEGLLTPGRSANGYRDYSDADIERLKQIVILRKLGFPVQQIADILDGALPLQEALDINITALNAEIEKLNGSLVMCKQIKDEAIQILETERYWEIIHEKEGQGLRFQSLVSDYISFLGPTLLRPSYWIPETAWHNPMEILKYIFEWSLITAFLYSLIGKDFGEKLGLGISSRVLGIILGGILMLPLYLLSRKSRRIRELFEIWLPVLWIVLAVILYLLVWVGILNQIV